jgi:hypothetical protein
MPMTVVDKQITLAALVELANERYGDLVKAVVDVERGLMMVGGELHFDAEQYLLENGSAQQHLWGINLYPALSGEKFIEFDSVINLRPRHNNRTRGVDHPDVRQKIQEIVNTLVQK